jgi:hypothetical protein
MVGRLGGCCAIADAGAVRCVVCGELSQLGLDPPSAHPVMATSSATEMPSVGAADKAARKAVSGSSSSGDGVSASAGQLNRKILHGDNRPDRTSRCQPGRPAVRTQRENRRGASALRQLTGKVTAHTNFRRHVSRVDRMPVAHGKLHSTCTEHSDEPQRRPLQ